MERWRGLSRIEKNFWPVWLNINICGLRLMTCSTVQHQPFFSPHFAVTFDFIIGQACRFGYVGNGQVYGKQI
jgi:hypothetical protein